MIVVALGGPVMHFLALQLLYHQKGRSTPNSLATLAEILFEAAQSGVGCLASKCSQCLTLYFAENGQQKGSVGYLVSS